MPAHRKPAPMRVCYLLSTAFFLSAALHVAAQDSGSFDCRPSVGGLEYNFSGLGGPQVLNRTTNSPPSEYVDMLVFDMCADLPETKDRAPEDQCLPGTRACLTTLNRKEGEPDRITAVVPIATSQLNVETSVSSSPRGVVITFHGPSYPPSSPNSVPQSLKVQLTCAEATREPQFSSYESGQVLVEWNSSAACGTTGTPKEDQGSSGGGQSGGKEGEAPIERVGSGLGFFFLMLVLAFIAYFALGAYYNYSTYGARGWDLIPHRDFWREVPYMLQDVIAHLCSNVRTQRSSRGGYIAV